MNTPRETPACHQPTQEPTWKRTTSDNFLVPPPETEFNYLSLGAGVQSSCVALMAAQGEITPTPNAAIFADTKAEPASVYAWLEWLRTQIQRCKHPFPIMVVTRGSLTDQILKLRTSKNGRKFSSTDIPFFTKSPDGGPIGKIPNRACTRDFKIIPITRKIRELAGIKKGQKNITVTKWIGISWDELQRIKHSREPWAQHRWPLCEHRMRRTHCLEWMASKGYPRPPRSSCIYCPFHNNMEWRHLRDEEPKEWKAAIKFERDLQSIKKNTDNMISVPYLHRSGIPLDQVDLTTDEERGQSYFDFQSECNGMCGV